MNNNCFELLVFSDPLCTWCWGSEPVIRKIEGAFEGQLTVKTVMGGLIPNITDLYDDFEVDERTIPAVSKAIHDHWLHAARIHRMPVITKALEMFDEENNSSFPVNIAYHAAKLASPELADRFLRGLRESAMCYGIRINQRMELNKLAESVGLDLEKFDAHMNDGSAAAAFRSDLASGVEEGIQIYPAWLLRSPVSKSRLNNYHHYPRLEKFITDFGAGALVPRAIRFSEEAAEAYFHRYISSAVHEFSVYFDMTDKEAEQILNHYAENNKIRKADAGTGALYYWKEA